MAELSVFFTFYVNFFIWHFILWSSHTLTVIVGGISWYPIKKNLVVFLDILSCHFSKFYRFLYLMLVQGKSFLFFVDIFGAPFLHFELHFRRFLFLVRTRENTYPIGDRMSLSVIYERSLKINLDFALTLFTFRGA